MTQKMYFTVDGQKVQQIFADGEVGFSLAYLAKVLRHVPLNKDYREQEYGTEVSIPVTTLMRYIEGAGVTVETEEDFTPPEGKNWIEDMFRGTFETPGQK